MTKCLIVSGQTFCIEMEPEFAARFKAMIELQWALTVIAAISGTASLPEHLPDYFEDETLFTRVVS